MFSDRPWIESLVSCIPDPVAFLKADWTILWANRELSKLVGQEHGLKGQRWERLIEDWSAHAAPLSGEIAPGTRIVLPVTLRREDGTLLPIQLHLARCNPGLDAAWSVLLRDEREIAELRHRISERDRSHSFLQANTSDLIVRTDESFRITWRNENAAVLFAEGATLPELVSGDSMSPFLSEQRLARFEVALQCREGARPLFFLRGIARRLVDEQGHPMGLSLLLRDDSERFRFSRFCATHALSAREEEVVEYLVKGYSNLNIASILGLSESGVKFHVRNVFSRAKVATRTELMALLLE